MLKLLKTLNLWIICDRLKREPNLETDNQSYPCKSLTAFNDPQLVKAYGNLKRSPELRSKGGGAFKHLFFYHRPDSSKACLHFTYAYG